MKVQNNFRLFAAIISIFFCCNLQAQNSREYIRNAIRGWGECRNVTITKRNGDMALYGSNGFAHSGCPRSLTNAIDELRADGEFIDDVQLTDGGKWIILYGNNGFQWSDIPYSLESKIREFNKDNEVVTAVTMNDANQWIVITTKYISASDQWIQDWLAEGIKDYGQLWAACITDDAMVAVYENGFKFYGEVPNDLRNALREADFDVYRLKIAGTAWFFADKNGRFRYNM